MRLFLTMTAMLAALCLVVSGCARPARGIGEAFSSQQEIDAKDDDACKSLGASPGTPLYVDCRLRLRTDRSNQANAIIMMN